MHESEPNSGKLMRIFEVETRDGHVNRQPAQSLESLRDGLADGYKITGEVFGAESANHSGGSVHHFDGSAPALMGALRAACGDGSWAAFEAKFELFEKLRRN